MDSLTSGTTTGAKPLSRAVVAALAVIILLVLALDLGERANLVDPIPIALTVVSGAAFFAAGIWLSFRLTPPSYFGAIRRAMAHASAPIFGLVIGTFLARTAMEAAAFAGLDPIGEPTRAFVIGKSTDKLGDHSAIVSFGPATREVYVQITPDLYDRLEPRRAAGRDCLKLSTETGRWGIRRTMLPRRFFDEPIGADQYVQCAQE